MKFLILLLFALPLQALSEEYHKPPSTVTIPKKPEGADIFVTLQFEGKEYVLIVPKKGAKEGILHVFMGTDFKPASPKDVDALKNLSHSLLGASFLKRLVVVEKQK